MTEESPTPASPLGAQIADIRQRQADARERVIRAGHQCDRAIAERSAYEPAIIIEAAFMELAAVWREEAVWWEASGKRGGKGTAKELNQAAARLAGFAVGLAAASPEAKAPRPAPQPQAPCEHPDEARSVLNSGQMLCTACSTIIDVIDPTGVDFAATQEPQPVLLDDVLPLVEQPHHNGDNVQPEGVPLFVAPATVANILTTATNPFASPPPPGRSAKPVTRLSFSDLPRLISDTYPVPRSRLSYSYVDDMAQCGLKALFGDASRHEVLGPRRPSWSLVGGAAFHDVVEQIERAALAMGGAAPSGELGDADTLWVTALDAAMDAQVQALAGGPYADPASWHVANKGLENYDWWRVHGVDMVKLYEKVHDNAWRAAHTLLRVPVDPTAPASTHTEVLEFAYEAPAAARPLPDAPILDSGRIDAAWMAFPPADGTLGQYPQPTLEIIDFKSGARDPGPDKRFQLVNYGNVIRRYLPANLALPVVGRFYLARKGIYTPPLPLPFEAGRAEVEYRFTAADRAMRAGVFAPSPSSFCSGCGSVDYCPTQSFRDSS